jgi:tetrathionate reductase subunit B
MIRRRDFFRKSGLTAILAMFGVGIGKERAQASQSRKWAMIVDLNRCSGCRSCVIACKAQNKTEQGAFLTTVLSLEQGEYPDSRNVFVPVLCNQCEDAPCIKACPENATYRLDNGVVVTDWNTCTGAGDCIQACPYQARFPDSRFADRSDKCDFCINRIEQGLEPACVEACPQNARIFGDLNAPKDDMKSYLQRSDLIHRKPKLKIASRVWYVSSTSVD